MKKLTDTDLLNWVAIYVTELAELHCKKPRHTTVEMIARDGDAFCLVVKRTARTPELALRKCVRYGMTKKRLQLRK